MSEKSSKCSPRIQLNRAGLITVILASLFGTAGLAIAATMLLAPQMSVALFATETPTPTATLRPTPTSLPTPTLSAEEVYAEAITSVMATIEKFDSRVSSLDNAFDNVVYTITTHDDTELLSEVDFDNNGYITVLEYLAFMDYGVSLGARVEPEMLEILERPLGIPSDRVNSTAFDVISKMEGLTPPGQVVTYHREILRCAYAQQMRTELIRSYFDTGTMLNSWDASECNQFDASVRGIKQFVNEILPED